MKRLLILALTAAMVALAAAPANAQGGGPPCIPTANGGGAATCTVNMPDVTFVLPGPPPCSGLLAGNTAITGNGVAHVTVSPDGTEFWATETIEGGFAAPAAGPPLVTGHLATWFGIEFNQNNQVIHGTFEGAGTGPSGNFGFSANFDMTTNAIGEVTAFHKTFTCR